MGLKGEAEKVYTVEYNEKAEWSTLDTEASPSIFMWYKVCGTCWRFVDSIIFYYHLHGSFSFPLFELDILQHPRRNRSCCSRSRKYGKGTSMGQRTPYWKVLEYHCPKGWMWQNLWLSWSLHFRQVHNKLWKAYANQVNNYTMTIKTPLYWSNIIAQVPCTTFLVKAWQ